MNEQTSANPPQGSAGLALKILVGDRKDEVVRVLHEVLIGRAPECDLRVGDPRVSRRHVVVSNPGGHLVLRDLQSQNGTWVNASRVDHVRLRMGDLIRVGSIRLQVVEAPRFQQRSMMLVDGGTGDMRVSRFDPRTISRGTSLPGADDLPGAPSQQRLEESLARLRNYAGVVELSNRIRGQSDVNTMLHEVLGELLVYLKADRGIVALVEDAPDELRPEVVVYRDGRETQGVISLSRTIAKKVMEGRVGVITDVALDVSRSESLLGSPMRALLAVPLQAGARALGLLELSTLQPGGAFTEMDLELVQVVASMLGPELHHRELAVEQEQTIARLQEARKQLEALDTLKARAQRAAVLRRKVEQTAHEMRNQLTTLTAAGLLKEFGADQGVSDYVDQLEQSGKRAGELLEEMVRVVSEERFSEARLRPGSLAEAARRAERHMRFDNAIKNHRLDLVILDDPLCQLDLGAIRDVVINLVRNAGQAIQHNEGHIVLRVEARDRHATLSVVDNGPGIPDTLVGRIFDEHVSTKDDGMGVGLSIAKATVEAHGGTLTVRTRVGTGTTFTLRLPLALETLGSSETAELPLPDLDGEDDPTSWYRVESESTMSDESFSKP